MDKIKTYKEKLKSLGVADKTIEEMAKRFKIFLNNLPSGYSVDALEHAKNDYDNIKNPIKYK